MVKKKNSNTLSQTKNTQPVLPGTRDVGGILKLRLLFLDCEQLFLDCGFFVVTL